LTAGVNARHRQSSRALRVFVIVAITGICHLRVTG